MLRFRAVLILFALAVLLPGCGCGNGGQLGTTPVTPTPPGAAASSIYVGNLSAANVYSILQFASTAQGSATPIASLTLPSGFEITCLTTDSSGQIYVGGTQQISGTTTYTWEVLVYAAGASGNATPVRTVVGSSNSFETFAQMAVDSSGQLYVLATQPAKMVAVMSPTANGVATPVRTITGSATQLVGNPLGIAVDSSGTIYVSNTGAAGSASVLAFASTANGNAAPVRVISGTNTGFGALYGMDTDASGNVYVLSTSLPIAPGDITTIEEFSPTANGNVAPIRTIGGSNTGMSVAAVMRVDHATGTIYVSIDGLPSYPSVATFAATASGNVAPTASFTSTAWYQTGYYGIALH